MPKIKSNIVSSSYKQRLPVPRGEICTTHVAVYLGGLGMTICYKQPAGQTVFSELLLFCERSESLVNVDYDTPHDSVIS